jgi:hypothetical protein
MCVDFKSIDIGALKDDRTMMCTGQWAVWNPIPSSGSRGTPGAVVDVLVKLSAIFRRTQELRSFSQVQPHYCERRERGQSIRIEDFSWDAVRARAAGGIWGRKTQFSGRTDE